VPPAFLYAALKRADANAWIGVGERRSQSQHGNTGESCTKVGGLKHGFSPCLRHALLLASQEKPMSRRRRSAPLAAVHACVTLVLRGKYAHRRGVL
jgi:hypothetical protein